jgi:hypothetical protein
MSLPKIKSKSLTIALNFLITDDFFVGIGDINDTYLPKVSYIIIIWKKGRKKFF